MTFPEPLIPAVAATPVGYLRGDLAPQQRGNVAAQVARFSRCYYQPRRSKRECLRRKDNIHRFDVAGVEWLKT